MHRRTELPGRCLQGRDDRAVQRLRAVLPGVVGEAAVRPQLGQHDEVGAGLGADQGGDPVDALGRGLAVAVRELDDVDLHAPSLARVTTGLG